MGSLITFDFGYFKMEMTRSAELLSGLVTFQQTLRHDGQLFSQRDAGTFTVTVPSNKTRHESILRYDIPESSFNMIYVLDFTLTANVVTAVQLKDIQVGC